MTYIRKVIINYDSNYHENITKNVYSVVSTYSTPNTDYWIRNNIWRSYSGFYGVVYIERAKNVIVENELFENSEDFGFDTYAFLFVDNVIMRNITTSNLTSTGSSSEYFIYLYVNDGATVYLDEIFYKNCHIGKQAGFYIDGLTTSLTIKNSIFQNLTLGTENHLISTGEFNTLYISNLTFYGVNIETTNDLDNFMIKVDAINLNNASNSEISDITISNSDVSFLSFNLITGEAATPINFTLSGIEYKN